MDDFCSFLCIKLCVTSHIHRSKITSLVPLVLVWLEIDVIARSDNKTLPNVTYTHLSVVIRGQKRMDDFKNI